MSSLPDRNELEANFWTLGKFKSAFSQLTALWLNTHLHGSPQFGETGNNIFIIPILQMVEVKHCKVYWLTQSCTACLNGSRTPAGRIPTPGLLAVTLYLLLLTSDYSTALISSPFYTQIISLSYIKSLCHSTQTKLLIFFSSDAWAEISFLLFKRKHAQGQWEDPATEKLILPSFLCSQHELN